jgi:hypothetical protein
LNKIIKDGGFFRQGTVFNLYENQDSVECVAPQEKKKRKEG